MIEGTIPIIKNSNSVPEFRVLLVTSVGVRDMKRMVKCKRRGYLWVGKQVESLLVCGISLLKVILHEVTVT